MPRLNQGTLQHRCISLVQFEHSLACCWNSTCRLLVCSGRSKRHLCSHTAPAFAPPVTDWLFTAAPLLGRCMRHCVVPHDCGTAPVLCRYGPRPNVVQSVAAYAELAQKYGITPTAMALRCVLLPGYGTQPQLARWCSACLECACIALPHTA